MQSSKVYRLVVAGIPCGCPRNVRWERGHWATPQCLLRLGHYYEGATFKKKKRINLSPKKKNTRFWCKGYYFMWVKRKRQSTVVVDQSAAVSRFSYRWIRWPLLLLSLYLTTCKALLDRHTTYRRVFGIRYSSTPLLAKSLVQPATTLQPKNTGPALDTTTAGPQTHRSRWVQFRTVKIIWYRDIIYTSPRYTYWRRLIYYYLILIR